MLQQSTADKLKRRWVTWKSRKRVPWVTLQSAAGKTKPLLSLELTG